MFYEIFANTFDNINPLILHGIGIALLTILIPVALTIFGAKKEFEILDRNVVLDHMIKAKRFLFYLGMVFVPLIFFDILPVWFRPIGIIVWCVGIFYIVRILISYYRWMKGDKLGLRCEYLKRVKSLNDMVTAWRSVWQTEKINPRDELQFFEVFLDNINRLLGDNERQS